MTHPLLRLGIIADPQYAELPPDTRLNRYFANSLEKLDEAIDLFNSRDLDLVVMLGDLIDRGEQHFAAALERFGRCRHDYLLLPGNHDFAVSLETRKRVHALMGLPAPSYSRVIKGMRLIVLDTCEISSFATLPGTEKAEEARRWLARLRAEGALNAHDWNAGVSETQLHWLKGELNAAEAAGEKALVLGHYPLHPFSDHCLWNGDAVAAAIAESPAAIAYLNGHDHRGGHGRLGAVDFVTFKGMVDGDTETAFAILTLWPGTLEVEGFGRQDSMRLDRLPAEGQDMANAGR
ncbi:metallophosphoesterase [Rhizobium paknamense]|uniref:3',5'-cyclic AMP phosphodiesterase CpdA n=1 Tax=Rhizobium paknamense TaxID=1206817 RepID=A0ABU0I807_9HYPH|nr:metallophosphoesterase [Rhizobium paknamense]MDQ0454366.1 3',5'-cyclic AMP phosphodiesterase CpdA [Rhizobium paknamense]